jgi:hypothetical protein
MSVFDKKALAARTQTDIDDLFREIDIPSKK